MTFAIVTHGGAGADVALSDGTDRAADLGATLLNNSSSALDAVLAAVRDLEDDPRFNAGTGSNLRLDGESLEMDAAVMTSDGRSGAVANIKDVRNPIEIALAVRERTPHLLLAGEGALAFARKLGFPFHDPRTEAARQKIKELRKKVIEVKGRVPDEDELWRWRDVELAEVWNFARELDACLGDTVGAVARDEKGGFAAAVSTGGTLLTLRGRVGDTPLIGCGLLRRAGGCSGVHWRRRGNCESATWRYGFTMPSQAAWMPKRHAALR
jgi:beta-aspartyl-peptidase (threonine type)